MSAKKGKILVTGASGFIGRAIVDELLSEGKYEIIGIVNKRRESPIFDKPEQLKFMQADIADYNSFRKNDALTGSGTIIHCAALAHQFGVSKKEDFWRVNVGGTENICKLAALMGARRFILISSVSVYGKHSDFGRHSEFPIDESFDCRPVGFYAESKFESEKVARKICRKNSINLTILRPVTVVGEDDQGNTARLITQIDRGRFIWIGSGRNKKCLIYKNDVARAVRKVVEAPFSASTEIYNLSGEALSMFEIVSAISTNLNKKTLPIKIPDKLVRGFFRATSGMLTIESLQKHEATIEKWLSNDIFSGRKFCNDFNFYCKTTVTEAIKKQVLHYLTQKSRGWDFPT